MTEAAAEDVGLDSSVFTALAATMAAREDLTVFRRFNEFNILNLLILQEKIHKLAKEFKDLCPKKDAAADPASRGYLASYTLPGHVPKTDSRPQIEKGRREVWSKLQKLLRDYNTSLIEMGQLRSLPPPDPKDLAGLQRDLKNRPNPFGLSAESVDCWDSVNDDDFAVLRSDGKVGRLNIWVKFIIDILKWKLWGKMNALTVLDNPGNIQMGKGYNMGKAEMAQKYAFTSRFVMALFGGTALIVPTVIMTLVQGTNVSLITTSISVFLFALLLAFGATDATGKDVLSATAAYTAVLVVFVGTSLSGNNPAGELSGSNTSTGT